MLLHSAPRRILAVSLALAIWPPLLIANSTLKRPNAARITASGYRELSGLVLGKSTVADVSRVFGPAPERQTSEPQITTLCYTSGSGPRTVLQFFNWYDPIEFRIFRGKPAHDSYCRPSRLVSTRLATAAGLRLGLSPKQVIALLGRPTRVRGHEFVYCSEYQQPKTPQQIAADRRAGLPKDLLGPTDVWDTIKIKFGASGAAYIDVEHDEYN